MNWNGKGMNKKRKRQHGHFNLIPASITSPAALGWEVTWSGTSSTCGPPGEHQRTIGQHMALVRAVVGEHRQKTRNQNMKTAQKQRTLATHFCKQNAFGNQNTAVKHDANPGWSCLQSWLPGLILVNHHASTRCRYNRWLTIGSGFNNKHCKLESRRLGNQSVQSLTWVLFGGLVGSLACWPILHLESTMSTAYVVCCARDRTGRLDKYHDAAHVLLVFYNGIWLLVELEIFKSNDRTLKHMTSWKTSYPSGNHPLIWEMRHSRRLHYLKLTIRRAPKGNFIFEPFTSIYLQGRAVSLSQGKIPKMNVNQPAALFWGGGTQKLLRWSSHLWWSTNWDCWWRIWVSNSLKLEKNTI